MTRPNAILALVEGSASASKIAPPQNKGRLLFVEDVQELLPKRNGKPVSRWVCNNSIAPEYAMKIGRAKAWWEADLYRWLDEQRVGRAS